ncbi:MAG TPA: hypothetical protein VD838_03715, partial [Anaeromyxobacteraceae bacterium]|nr:hypothetical protein [Anaeromyxobacteraceae bacterium]
MRPMGARILLATAIAGTLACGAGRDAIRPEPDLVEPRDPEPVAPVDPPLAIERVFAGAIPVAAAAGEPAPAFREAYFRVRTDAPFRIVALRLDGVCRGVFAGEDGAPSRGEVVRIGEAPGSDYRVGAAIACPTPFDAPAWQALLFYEAGGAVGVLPFQFVQVSTLDS